MRLSKFGYYADFVGAILFSAAFFMFGMWNTSWIAKTEWVAWCLFGLVLWTLVEYFVHRWIYHGVEYFIRLHGEHHRHPNDFIGAPPLVGIGLILLAVYWPVSIFSPLAAGGVTSGLLLGYAAYQLVHHADHFWQPNPSSYLYRARLHHAAHHYHNQLGNFGVTTALWDQAFGSIVAAHSRRQHAETTHNAGQ